MTNRRGWASLGRVRRTTVIWLLTAVVCVLVAGSLVTDSGGRSKAAQLSATDLKTNHQWEVSTVAELRDALAQLAPGGGTIYLRPGDFLLDQPLEIRARHNVNLVGAGWVTRIIRRGEGDALQLVDAGFCVIRNLLLLGDESATSGSGVVLQGACSSCTIDFCRIINFGESGVRFVGDPERPMSSNSIRNCHFIGNLGDQLWSFHNNDFFIVGNQFGTHRSFPRSGCVLDHSSAGSYTLNYHWGNQVALKMGPAANYNRIENNRFEESREVALAIGSSAGGDWNMFNIITGNTFHTNSQTQSGAFAAVVACDAHETTFCNNQIFSWNSDQFRHRHSLLIDKSCNHWIITGNIFRHNQREALVYDFRSQMIVKDNLMD
ncbi:MAG: right-handed parallel beta-helix repeat-containing protein [Pirellulaceae bacterium]